MINFLCGMDSDAFPKGLASTLYSLGADDLMIREILSHGDVSVTRQHYIRPHPRRVLPQCSKLGAAFGALCAGQSAG